MQVLKHIDAVHTITCNKGFGCLSTTSIEIVKGESIRFNHPKTLL